MRRLLQIILLKPILWTSSKFASKPRRERIFKALTELFEQIKINPGKKGITLQLNGADRFIVLSDQHRGTKNGADDFRLAEPNYLAALEYYSQNNFQFISLGDSEELWENSLYKVKKYNNKTFEAERRFIEQNRFYKVFGNHDLYWTNDPLAGWQLKKIYGQDVKVYEGLVIQLTIDNRQQVKSNKEDDIHKNKLPIADCNLQIYLTHGHQGDASSDGNWFSKFFVANIWAPLQAFLRINPNTPAYDEELKTAHNRIMYEWSAKQKNLLLITGHTHQPVFESLTHLERLYKRLQEARKNKDAESVKAIELEILNRKHKYTDIAPDYLDMQPVYFNSGCCCFSDGDITGIEITAESISLVKWSNENKREILETAAFNELLPAML